MTESYGWFCSKCGLRYRDSVCDRNKNTCPSGHDLNIYGYWVYRKEYKNSLDVRVSKQMPDGRTLRIIDEWVSWHRVKEKMEELIYKNPEYRDLIENAFMVSASISENDWRVKCSLCKFYNSCKKWKTIFCKDFQPKKERRREINE